MSSTYSSYKFELIGTGEQAGTWGASTNINIGTAIEQAIGGYVTVTFTTTTKTLTLANTSAAQDARALYLNLDGSPGGAATLEVPAIQKAYIIKNATTGGYTVTAKVTGMTGVDIPNGKTMLVYNNGTDVVLAHDNFSAPVTVNVDSSSDALRITQIGSGNALTVEDSTNPDATPFVITSAGIGVIGYTASTTNGSGSASLFQVNGLSAFQSAWWGADTFPPINYFLKSRSGIYGTQGLVSDGDGLGTIIFKGSDGINFISGASIRALVQGTPGVNDMPTRLLFSTTYDGASSPTTALTINSEGVVEIGIAGGVVGNGALLRLSRDMVATAGGNSYGVLSTSAITSATSQVFSFFSDITTAATAFTLGNLNHYGVGTITPGAGSTITNMRGFYVTPGMSTATNNYGFVSGLASAANTWNFYASGTANNAFNGNCRFGGVTAPVATVDVTGSVAATTTILSSGATSGIGYGTGAGGTVTQTGTRTTGVTLNKTTGAITLVSAAGSASYQSFLVTNSAVAATDVVIVNQKSGTDKYIILVTAVAAGSFQITFATTGGTTTEQPVFNFAVIKGVAA